jgi:hypothetical protein
VGQPLPTVGAVSYPSYPAPDRSQVSRPEGEEDQPRQSESPPHQHQQESRQLPSLSLVAVRPDSQPRQFISELVSRRTTVETPGSLNPQPARRGRIRKDATVPQSSVIPTRTSPGRLSPRAPTASPDSTSARRSQRLEPKRPRTSSST